MQPPGIPVSVIEDPLRVSGKYFRVGDEVCFLKAVTFGPFPAGAFPDEGRSELRRIKEELGANAIRLYEIPTLDFMHDCAELGLRVFITLPWSQHLDFLDHRKASFEAEQLLVETITKFRGHPALAGYFVANAIEPSLVRWMGARRVLEFLERLIDRGRAHDPDALFVYANCAETEWLLPKNQDFVAFNHSGENPEMLRDCLSRWQSLSGSRPLVLSEFRVDSLAAGELSQAGGLEQHVEEVCRSGSAGTMIFGWSDLWQQGGKDITEWDFGLNRRDKSAKPALEVLREKWGLIERPNDELKLGVPSAISIVVCTYRGSATLVRCLDSLITLDYPDYDVVVVNEGSDQRVEEIARTYESVRLISMPREGIGAARNLGVAEAKGDIIVFTDDDCFVESDWLRWIGWQFEQNPKLGCSGGPTIVPEVSTMEEAVIAATPGDPVPGPLTDSSVDFLSGSNLAIKREVFEKVGEFNSKFRYAGEDFDFCWRALDAGYELGFQAAAFVWHGRPSSKIGFLKEQAALGRAETLLTALHQKRFREIGGVDQRQKGLDASSALEPTALRSATSWTGEGLSGLSLHLVWWLGVLAAGIAGIYFWPFLIVGGMMTIVSIVVAHRKASLLAIQSEHDSGAARWWLTWMIVIQGATRSGARWRYGWRSFDWWNKLSRAGSAASKKMMSGWWKLGIERSFQSNEGVNREQFLEAVLNEYPGSLRDTSNKTDIIIEDGLFWNWAILTATEFHEDDRQVMRLRLLARPQLLTRILALMAILLIPAAIVMGVLGEVNVLIALLAIYLLGEVAARLFMWMRRPRLSELARSLGLKPL